MWAETRSIIAIDVTTLIAVKRVELLGLLFRLGCFNSLHVDGSKGAP